MVVDAIVVVGASTGGLHPLRRIIEALPHHCSAAVFVVMHSGAASSILPEILSWHSRVDVSFATDGGSIEAGRVYVAPPDRHMILELDHMWLTREPKVHATRPAADPLFASAATVYGDRVLGIVLSGEGCDGAAGLATIKAHGGGALVEDPSEAPVPSMPAAAIAADSPEALHIDVLAHRVAAFCSLSDGGGKAAAPAAIKPRPRDGAGLPQR